MLTFARGIQTDSIDEAEASQKSKLVSKTNTPAGLQKHKRTFKENRISPESNRADPPPTASTEDTAADEEGYKGPWKLRSLAPISFAKVTPSEDQEPNTTSRNGKLASCNNSLAILSRISLV